MKPHQKVAQLARKNRQERNRVRREQAHLDTLREPPCKVVVATADPGVPTNGVPLNLFVSGGGGRRVIAKMKTRIHGSNREGMSVPPLEALRQTGRALRKPAPVDVRIVDGSSDLEAMAKELGGIVLQPGEIKGGAIPGPSFTPVWEPLEKFLGDDRVGQFMFIATYTRDDGRHIHAYKHRGTRRYLNLDDSGHCYRYGDGGYTEIPAAVALERAFS